MYIKVDTVLLSFIPVVKNGGNCWMNVRMQTMVCFFNVEYDILWGAQRKSNK